MHEIKISFYPLIFSSAILVQSAKINGKVINSNSGQPLGCASLTLIEKSILKVANQNGGFSFNKLGAGTYSIKCSYKGYETKIIVKDNDSQILVFLWV